MYNPRTRLNLLASINKVAIKISVVTLKIPSLDQQNISLSVMTRGDSR